MKKYILLLTLLSSGALYAQVPEDALRYSWFPQNGTARNLAIGGAMGSLGGDINATFVNPAGLGFYKTGEFVFSPGFTMNKNKADYRDTRTQQNKNAFSMGPIGVVLGGSDQYSKKSGALSIAFTQVANFNNEIRYKGLNNLSSFSEQFAEEFAKANADPRLRYSIDDVLNSNSPLPYGSAPALYTYLIDTVRVNGVLQVKAAPEYILDAGQALMQEMYKKTTGGLYEAALGIALNQKDKWFFGGTIGMPLVNYNSHTTFNEYDTSQSTTNQFQSFEYQDYLETKGVGVNLKLGAIYRPQEYIRIGLALHTPSFMWLTDTRHTTLLTRLEPPQDEPYIASETFTGGSPGKNKYMQMSPWRAILSASYVFREVENVKRQRAFISADVEYINHGGSRFYNVSEDGTLEKDYYKGLNEVVKQQYKGTVNFRVGGELKFNTIMGRLGFAYYGRPYKEAALKASQMLLSGGLGYRNKGFFIDLTYIHHINKDVDFPYRLEDRQNTYAVVKQQQGNIAATVGFKF
ncbi:MAG: hypothetical protein JWQ27_777 [Ferruginibacter sp.]|nr:hypothetical protein [Ferruginibacter sp.]